MSNAIHTLIRELKERRGSDLHLSPGYPIIMRLNGELTERDATVLTPAHTQGWIETLLDARLRADFERTGEADFAIEVPSVARARANVFRTQRGWAGVFRLIPEQIPSVDDLSLPPAIQGISKLRSGMVLVTGPTGSGKSTTLAAIIDAINREREAHILTIEDPIEFVHPNKRAHVTQRAVGIHAPSFAEAIRAAGREDPDVILVGEMRDLDTISQALTCAEFGILVFGTLHTNSAPKSVDRIVDSFPADQQSQVRSMLAESLKFVVAQRLMRTKDGQGRVGAFEILISSPAIANLIREGKTAQLQSVMQTGTQAGMQTMDQALAKLVAAAKVSVEDAMECATDPVALQRLAGGAGMPVGGPVTPSPRPSPMAAAPGTRPPPGTQPPGTRSGGTGGPGRPPGTGR
ncbi:MAG: type IV pilus twitching motility protein PilT [bacterium]